MSVAVSFKITGAKELQKKLRELGPKIEKKVMRQALRAGAKIIQAEAKKLAPVDSGELRAGIKVRAVKKRKPGQVRIRVSTGEDDAFYGFFVEYGYMKQETRRLPDGKIISLKRGQGTPTFVPPRPFVRPAFETKKEEATKAITAAIAAGIEREASRGAAA